MSEEALLQRWRLALSLQPTLPLISRACCLDLIDQCHRRDIKIANLFFHRVCTGCGRIYQPGLNCLVRYRPWNEIRRLEKAKRVSRLTNTPGAKKQDCIVYECVCNTKTIFDIKIDDPAETCLSTSASLVSPVLTSTPIPSPAPTPTPSPPPPAQCITGVKPVKLDKKAAELQRVLSRSKKSETKLEEPSSLSSFLKSLKK